MKCRRHNIYLACSCYTAVWTEAVYLEDQCPSAPMPWSRAVWIREWNPSGTTGGTPAAGSSEVLPGCSAALRRSENPERHVVLARENDHQQPSPYKNTHHCESYDFRRHINTTAGRETNGQSRVKPASWQGRSDSFIHKADWRQGHVTHILHI